MKEGTCSRHPTLPHRAYLAIVLCPAARNGRWIIHWAVTAPRIPDWVVFEKLVHVLVFDCAYHGIADEGCSATTLWDRRHQWIELGSMDALREIVLEAYDRHVGLEAADVAVDARIKPRLLAVARKLAETRSIGAKGPSNARRQRTQTSSL